MHAEYPSVKRLSLHLPNEQFVLFDPETDTVDQLQQRAASKNSTLTAFFEYNTRYPDG